MANKIYVGQEGAQELYRRVKALSANFATAEQGAKADAAYQKPVDGIPKSDLDSGVQASLGKADTALQKHQDISGKVDKVSPATEGNLASLDVNGNLVDSGVSSSVLTSKAASDGGTDLSLVTTGEKYVWNDWTSADYQIPPETIKIGDKYYHIVTIGNQQWMAENLDYVWNGLTADSTASGCYNVWKKTNYCNNDQSRYGAYGRLYDWHAAKHLNDNVSTILGTKLATDGWHIPSQADFDALITYAGGTSTAGTKLKMTSIRGTDDYGFSWQPGGLGQDSGGNIAYYRWGQWGLIWSLYEYDSSRAYTYTVGYESTSCGTRLEPKLFEASIRLVRNLT